MKGLNNMNNSSNTKVKALKWAIVGVLLIGIPFVLDYLVDVCDWDKNNLFIIAANNIFPALGTICLLSFAWEIWSKRSFAKEVLELSDVSDNYIESGIKTVYRDFSKINWDELFNGAKEVTCVFTYAYTWRNNNRSALEMLQSQGTKVTIILPDYRDNEIVESLNKDFSYDKYAKEENSKEANKNVKNLIEETKQYFESKNATIILYKGRFKSTYYLIDDYCVMAPFNHGNNKPCVPAILCEKDGILYEFCKNDIEAIKQNSDGERI